MKIFNWFKYSSRVSTMVLLGLTIWSQNGCKPIAQDALSPSPSSGQPHSGAREGDDLTVPVENETPTILGQQMPNPYLVPNMKQAYRNLGRSNWNSITATHNYVRFRPASADQLRNLEETFDMELSDTPLDYMIAQEGDYYQDPAVADEDISYQYAVVRIGDPFPSDIPYDLLASVHVPDDLALESEAERLVGLNSDGELGCSTCRTGAFDAPQKNAAPQPDVTDCGTDGHYDFDLHQCVPNGCASDQHYDYIDNICVNNCPAGYSWNGSECVSNTPTHPPGRITLRDNTENVDKGVRTARLVARRWFKIERISTDGNGYFSFNKHFGNKVKLFVKFKNSDAVVREVRSLRLWKMFFPVKYQVGTYNGSTLNSATFTFERQPTVDAKGTRLWVAATVHNNVQEYRDLVAGQGTPTPPTDLKIQISNWGSTGGGATPLFRVRTADGLVEAVVTTFALSTAGPAGVTAAVINAVVAILKRQVDVLYCYTYDDVNRLTSDAISETMYHELSHAATYPQAGNDWYTAFVNAEVNEIVFTAFDNDFKPYGHGDTPNSPIIAVGEGWAYYYGHFLADLRYGTSASCQREQTGGFTACSSTGTGHPHIDVIELFDPGLMTDNFRWIPKGVFLDLNDTNNEGTPIIDLVSGYTNQQMFQSIEADVRNVPTYRDRLLSKYGSSQATEVINLFQRYGY